MDLVMIHERVSTAMILFSAIAAIWGFVLYLRGQGIGGNYWGILASAELLFAAQGIIGFVLWLSGGRPGRGVHILYGVVAVITLPAFYAFSRGRDDRPMAISYALVLLFLAGVSLRAIGTAG